MCRKRAAGLNRTVSNTLKEADDLVGFLRLGTYRAVLNVLIALTPGTPAASQRKGLATPVKSLS